MHKHMHSPEGCWALEQAPQDSCHGLKLLEFKKHLNSSLRHRVWFSGGLAWSQELDLVILVGPCQLGLLLRRQKVNTTTMWRCIRVKCLNTGSEGSASSAAHSCLWESRVNLVEVRWISPVQKESKQKPGQILQVLRQGRQVSVFKLRWAFWTNLIHSFSQKWKRDVLLAFWLTLIAQNCWWRPWVKEPLTFSVSF